ncbi:hypothetical protein N658DRAFT_551736 [Parathielavia hyrcaniae]|uniref:Uncharacterized protein n=1 Tax=Parathielavia hyrcaniae TaxID=113614 RepID=A0AAN6SXE0_9PEZI|nr:hypothetical protein N658DRAFT_551736 [Parathielavia hyrcaniae]
MKISTILQLLGLGLSAQKTLALPIDQPADTPDLTSRDIAAGLQKDAQQESYLNCSGGHVFFCEEMGTYCYGFPQPYSNNIWCALNCECFYVHDCCIVIVPDSENGEGHTISDGAEIPGTEISATEVPGAESTVTETLDKAEVTENVAAEIEPPATSPNLTSRDLAAGLQQDAQQESYLNCSNGWVRWCMDAGTYCDGNVDPLSLNTWCALNCECFYQHDCCTVAGPEGEDDAGHSPSMGDAAANFDAVLNGNAAPDGAEITETTETVETVETAGTFAAQIDSLPAASEDLAPGRYRC